MNNKKQSIEEEELNTINNYGPINMSLNQLQDSNRYQNKSNLSYQSLPTNSKRPLNSYYKYTLPQDSWKAIKKWIGNINFQKKSNQSPAKQSHQLQIERQLELNRLFPLILAMTYSRDEYNMKRIPVLLNQLTVKISKVSEDDQDHDYFSRPTRNNSSFSLSKKKKQVLFKITIQYGGISWSVYRRYWDFVKLHYRYRKKYNTTRDTIHRNLSHTRTKPPKFPSIPKRHIRKQKNQSSQQQYTPNPANNSILDEDGVMALVSPMNDEDENSNNSRHLTLMPPKNMSLTSSPVVDVVKADPTVLNAMEDYLNQFIATIPPLGNINRLCKFLEISALGLHLTAKYPNVSYHGKEGFAVFQSRTDHDPKQVHRFLQDGIVCSFPTTGGRRRRKPKWFIVRESYVVCVDDPSEMNIYDVFLVDQEFDIHRLDLFGDKSDHHKTGKKKLSNMLANASHWASGKSTICLKNLHGVYHFRTKNELQAKQFELSIKSMSQHSVWIKENRFDSFAPIRPLSAVTWFVDGRDYFWDVSVALENAKECIYIHDWWLSPQLFLRRPASQNLEWRLDRLLRRKAEQGVKIYIVMYKEVAMALPLFSHYSKRHLLSLSPNIYVQRHPSRALDLFHKDSIFFWAHHEKICVVDNEIAFIGGLDLCFGRYDTSSHILVDDLNPLLDPQASNPQVWPGKDFSNPRIIDFHTLDKPFEDNQDRKTLPRMPWHDISMRIVGLPARDVARHFVQRWNLLRRKKPHAPKRPTPMILPVPDNYTNVLDSKDPRICHPHTSKSCFVQILRSVSPWSIGSTERIEHSIQNAYCESIKNSKHFIYIENQFFITSTKNGTTVIENKIGDAIYERIVRAHKEGKKWRAIIVIPLVPGFPANIDETEATTVRLIMQYQYYSISRGPNSLLARLHDAGVTNTHHYINFYGLRNWAELNDQFITEQVYIHSKTMIVDDRVVIIGSANINERSMLGTRDSEIAAHIEDDKETISSTINGQSVKVGRYAHTLRMRLMSEHIGLDVDQIDKDMFKETSSYFKEKMWTNRKDNIKNDAIDCVPPYIQVTSNVNLRANEKKQIQQEEKYKEVDMDNLERELSNVSSDSSATEGSTDKIKSFFMPKKKDKVDTPTIDTSQSKNSNDTSLLSPSKSIFGKRKSKEDYLDFWTTLDPDTDNNDDTKFSKESSQNDYYNNIKLEQEGLENKTIGEIYQLLKDPLSEEFQNFWYLLARFNTNLFRHAFLAVPDNNVRTWDQYHQFTKMAKIFLGRTDSKHGGTKTSVAAANVNILPNYDGTIRNILHHIRGHLVIWPTHFMEDDDLNNEFIFNVDKIVPIEIFD